MSNPGHTPAVQEFIGAVMEKLSSEETSSDHHVHPWLRGGLSTAGF